MKKTLIITFLAVLWPFVGSFAQGSAALERFSDNLSHSRAEFTYSFSSGKDTKIMGSGKATLQGECFLVNGNGLEIRCDGKEIWTIDRKAKEATAESLAIEGMQDLYANPALLIANLANAFNVRFIRDTNVSGKSAAVFALSPKESITDFNSMTVTLAADGSAIFALVVTTKDGTVTSFTIPSFKFCPMGKNSEFSTAESSFDKSYLITDLR